MKPVSATAKLSMLQAAGIGLIGLGLFVLTGHIFNMPEFEKVGTDTAMAPPTAVGFLVIGISKFVLASALKKNV